MKLKAIIPVLLLTACSSVPNSPEKENYSVQALTQNYLQKKIDKLITASDGVRLLKELEYASHKHPLLLKDIIASQSNPVAYYNDLLDFNEISLKRASVPSFHQYLNSLNPVMTGVSCLDLYNQGDTVDGVKTIDPDGEGGNAGFSVYCNMTQGGWTMVVAQYETDAVGWNEGIQADYDPSLATKKSFTLNSAQLPPDRTQTGFGKNLLANEVDYADFVYHTGNIATQLLTGKKDGVTTYHIHRSTGGHFPGMDPESGSGAGADFHNSLTFDKTVGARSTWAFCPFVTGDAAGTGAKGYNYNGVRVRNTHETYAWTVWVK